MLSQLISLIQGHDTRARAMRSSLLVGVGFGASNLLRLISNLIMSRLLFPEAFGLMSIVLIFLTGIAMLSDLGLNVSIVQNSRGEEPDFLNTAWSLQIIRGAILSLLSCLLAYPISIIYDQPQLLTLIPIAGLTALIQGFTTTKVALANRHLQLGVQTSVDIGSQVIGLISTVIFAWITGSVWALVIGYLISALVKVAAQHYLLKGPSNRWLIRPELAFELVHFGKYIFLSSAAGFLTNQSDRAILGGFVSLSDLGIFAIAFIFSNLALELCRAIGGQIVFPLFCKYPTIDNIPNRINVLKARKLVLYATIAVCGIITIVSVPMINFLYDSRYKDAGPILALLGFTITTQIFSSNYDGCYLNTGNSKQHFYIVSIQAFLQLISAGFLISQYGLLGAIFASAATMLISYPYRAYVAHKNGAWDPLTDLSILAVGWSCTLVSIFIWFSEIHEFLDRI